MIIDAIVAIAGDLITTILGWFPDANAEAISTIESALYNVKETIIGFNWIFPVSTFFFCLNITIGVLVGIGLIRLIRWLGSIITHNTIH